jgi:hypothetical protein
LRLLGGKGVATKRGIEGRRAGKARPLFSLTGRVNDLKRGKESIVAFFFFFPFGRLSPAYYRLL